MTDEPPVDTEAPSTGGILHQLVEDGATYARAQADYVKAELGERSAFILPGLALAGIALALALALIVALIIVAMVWLSGAIGFGWAVAAMTSILLAVILLLFRASSRQFKKVFRPWQTP